MKRLLKKIKRKKRIREEEKIVKELLDLDNKRELLFNNFVKKVFGENDGVFYFVKNFDYAIYEDLFIEIGVLYFGSDYFDITKMISDINNFFKPLKYEVVRVEKDNCNDTYRIHLNKKTKQV